MSEIRALLLTDVVDSTRLAETLGDAGAAALGEAHDRVARDLLRACHGREIDKTDGMLMLFESAADALAFAVAYHKALSGLPSPLKARAGLHVGPVILRSNLARDVAHGAKPLEVEGIAKPVAARVMSLAQGGQTLLTAEARLALGATTLRVQSHGHWRIKGIAEPVELFEAGDDDAPFTPPPDGAKVYRVVRDGDQWLPVRQLRHSLPAERDAFVGRQLSLVDLARRFDAGARLVSLLGIGGTGKTRLALRFARCWLGDFPGGAWFCDLSQARNVDGLVHAVAQGLDVPLGKDDPVVQLGHAIAGRGRCLVILDNFEQIARHAEATLGRWLDRAADARFLVTTREVLGLPGEEAVALAPLPAVDAAALFVQRAAATKFDFHAGADDEKAIVQLVKLLDGLPLAIELAAARVRVMSPATLLSRMDQRFRLLVAAGGRRDRQATLRAAFDWSWDLLNGAEKSALAQLSVFEGGFTLPAAEAVVDLGACVGEHWVVDVLQSLVDKSLVRRVSESRFGLLVSVQEYAGERLRTGAIVAGGSDDAVRPTWVRHARWCSQLTERVSQPGDAVELDNLVAACHRTVLAGDSELASRVLQAAWQVLDGVGPFEVGVELALRALRMPGLGNAARARMGCVAGSALDATGKVNEAQRLLEEAIELARRAEDPKTEASAHVALGRLHASQSRVAIADEHYRRALDVARRVTDGAIECRALNGLGAIADELGRSEEARSHYDAALACAKAAGDLHWQGLLRGNLGTLMFVLGQPDEAREQLFEALEGLRRFGDRRGASNALCNLGALYQLTGRPQEALDTLQEAIEVARAIGHVRLECIAQANLGLAFMDLHRWASAQGALEAALSLARALGDRRSEALFLSYQSLLLARQDRATPAEALSSAAERLAEPLGDRFLSGLLHAHRAEVEALAGKSGAASAELGRARSIADEFAAGPRSEFGAALARAETLLRAAHTSSS